MSRYSEHGLESGPRLPRAPQGQVTEMLALTKHLKGKVSLPLKKQKAKKQPTFICAASKNRIARI